MTPCCTATEAKIDLVVEATAGLGGGLSASAAPLTLCRSVARSSNEGWMGCTVGGDPACCTMTATRQASRLPQLCRVLFVADKHALLGTYHTTAGYTRLWMKRTASRALLRCSPILHASFRRWRSSLSLPRGVRRCRSQLHVRPTDWHCGSQ